MLKSQKAVYLGKIRYMQVRAFDELNFRLRTKDFDMAEGLLNARRVLALELEQTSGEYQRMLWNG